MSSDFIDKNYLGDETQVIFYTIEKAFFPIS